MLRGSLDWQARFAFSQRWLILYYLSLIQMRVSLYARGNRDRGTEDRNAVMVQAVEGQTRESWASELASLAFLYVIYRKGMRLNIYVHSNVGRQCSTVRVPRDRYEARRIPCSSSSSSSCRTQCGRHSLTSLQLTVFAATFMNSRKEFHGLESFSNPITNFQNFYRDHQKLMKYNFRHLCKNPSSQVPFSLL